MKNKLLILILIGSLYGCGEKTSTSTSTSTSTTSIPDLKAEIQTQNQPNISINERLNQSQTVLVCGVDIYELENGKVRFYEYTGLDPNDAPIYKARNPRIVGPINFDSNTSTYTWKIEFKVLDRNITSVEQLFVNDRELLVKDSMTNQVNKISCMTFQEFSERFKMLQR